MIKNKLLTLVLLLPGLAQAQAVLHQTEAESGSYYTGFIGIDHGCEGSATTKITVDIPMGIRGVKPMPKDGWQLDIVKQQLDNPYTSHGKQVVEDVRQITWYGNTLEHAHYDEFAFRGQISTGATSKLYFNVKQTCVVGELDWNQSPENSHSSKEHGKHNDLKTTDKTNEHAVHQTMPMRYPAPVLTIIDGSRAHHH